MPTFLRISFFILLFHFSSLAQQTAYQTQRFSIPKLKSTTSPNFEKDFNTQIIHLEAPSPDGNSYKSFLMQQKIQSKAIFPYQNTTSLRTKSASTTPQPLIADGFGMLRKNAANGWVPIYGGLPNDNTAAVSKDGLLLLAINSNVYLRDLKTDSVLYPNQNVTLRQVFDLPSGNYYDPKITYDEAMDRFVLVFLKNNVPSTNKIMVGFSKTNNPIDGWHVYELPGNPLNNNRWTDFPTIALSNESLYFTGNLIIPNVSWQVGFDGSVLWEMDKMQGFSGAAAISPKLYADIRYQDKFVRNLHCVQGADGNVTDFHMLSNRNFDIENDTFFLVSLQKELDTSFLSIKAVVSDVKYGVPPNARQADTDTSDATKGLQTNDARVLGAIQFDNEIQFVGNTIYTPTGYSAVYHGKMNLANDEPTLKTHIIADQVKDFGYPNIAWTGNEPCDREAIIAFNHTSFEDFPGISAIYVDNEGNYSDVLVLKEGESIVDRIANDGYERWGDYFGMQRFYDQAGKVMTFGFTTDLSKANYGWVSLLNSPDTATIGYQLTTTVGKDYCTNKIQIQAFGGVGPYSVVWNNDAANQSLVSSNYCNGDTSFFTLYDARNCAIAGEYPFSIANINSEFTLFPNPTADILAFQFTAAEASTIAVNIYTETGHFVKQIAFQEVKKGLNELYFSTEPLIKGTYFVEILDGKTILSKNKFSKN